MVVVLLGGGFVSVGLSAVRSPLPQLDGEVTLPGLNGRVTVLRETYGVPQVYADQPEDLFEAQGYLEAEWQQPVASGRPPRHAYRLTAAGRRLALGEATASDRPAPAAGRLAGGAAS